MTPGLRAWRCQTVCLVATLLGMLATQAYSQQICATLTGNLRLTSHEVTACAPYAYAFLDEVLVEGQCSCGRTIDWSQTTVPEGVSMWFDEDDPDHAVGFYMDPDAPSGTINIRVTVTVQCSRLQPGCTTPANLDFADTIRVIGNTDGDNPCSSCAGGNGPGAGSPPDDGGGRQGFGPISIYNSSGPDVRMVLGADTRGTNAGFLKIRSTTSTADLGRPTLLGLPFTNLNLQPFGDPISQIKAPQGLVNVQVQNDNTYHLLFYNPPNIVTNGNTYSTNGNPFVTYSFAYTSDSSPLTVTEYHPDSGLGRQYQFTFDTQTSHWTLTDNQSARSTESWTAADGSTYDYQVKVGGQTIKSLNRTFDVIAVGANNLKVLTQLVEGSGGTTRTTSYTYDTSANLTLVVYSDGNWECNNYDASKRLTTTYSAWGTNSPPPTPGTITPDLTQHRYKLTQYAYELTQNDDGIDHSPAINGGQYMYTSWRRKIISLPYWTGSAWEMHEVGRAYRVLLPGSSEEKSCVTPGSTWTNSNNVGTLTVFNPVDSSPGSSLVKWERHVDGTYSGYTYSNVTLADGSSGFDTVVQTGEGSVDQSGSLTGIVNGTSTETVVDDLGRVRSVTTKSIASSTLGPTLSSLTYAYSGFDPSGQTHLRQQFRFLA